MKELGFKTGSRKYGDFVLIGGRMLFNRIGSSNAQSQKHKGAPEKRGVWAFPYPVFEGFYAGGNCSSPAQHSPEWDKLIKIDEVMKRQLVKRLKGLKTRMAIGMAKLNKPEPSYKALMGIKVEPPSNYYFGDEKYEIKELEEALAAGVIKGYVYHDAFRKKKYKSSCHIKRFWWGGPVYARFAPKGSEYDPNKSWYLYKTIYDYVKELRKHLFEYRKENWGGGEKLYKIGINLIGTRESNMSSDHLEVFIPMKGDLTYEKDIL